MTANLRGKSVVDMHDKSCNSQSNAGELYSSEASSKIESFWPANRKTRHSVVGLLNRGTSDISQQSKTASRHHTTRSAGRKPHLAPLDDDKQNLLHLPKAIKSSKVCFGNWSSVTSDGDLDRALLDAPYEANTIVGASDDADHHARGIDLRAKNLTAIPLLTKFYGARVLDLSGNSIRHISNLQNATELRELRLYDNRIVEISDLSRLRELKRLHLQHNNIESIGKGLHGLNKLQVLRLDYNQISGISRSEIGCCFQLTSLDLSCNRICSLAAVDSLPNLEELFMRNNRIKAVSTLSNCKKLKEIDLASNPLTDLSGLCSLQSLISINTSKCPLKSFSSLAPLRNLEELHAAHCQLTDLKDIVEYFPRLQVIDVSNNDIASVDELVVLSSLTELAEVSIAGNPAVSSDGSISMEALFHKLLPNLEYLDGRSVTKRHHSKPTGSLDNVPTLSDVMTLSRGLSLSDADTSEDAVMQLTALEDQVSSFETDFTTRFFKLRDSFNMLPEDSPLSARNSARPSSSRSGVKSRLQEAQQFASQHFKR